MIASVHGKHILKYYTLEELLDYIVLCGNCIMFEIADFYEKECIVMTEKKNILSAGFFFCSLNSRSRKQKERTDKMQND